MANNQAQQNSRAGGQQNSKDSHAHKKSYYNHHQEKNLFASIFGTAMLANKWQKAMDEDRQSKIVEMFTVLRDDPYDVYKPNSRIETQTLAEMPYGKPLTKEAIEMLHEIAVNYDSGCQLDIIEAFRPQTFISLESHEQLGRLPTWLKFLILFKYDVIHNHYQNHTHHFIKMLANYIDTKRSIIHTNAQPGLDAVPDEDFEDTYEIESRYLLEENQIVQPHPITQPKVEVAAPKTPGEWTQRQKLLMEKTQNLLTNDDKTKMKYALWKWKLPKSLQYDWTPQVIHRAATVLRRSLLAQPTSAEVLMVAEDERIRKNVAQINQVADDDDYGDASEDVVNITWDDMICDKAAFKAQIAKEVGEDLLRIPKGLSKQEREEEERDAMEMRKWSGKTKENKRCCKNISESKWWKKRKEKKRRTEELKNRAPFRNYSSIWKKNCPQEPIKQAKRFPHHYRIDESFHAYVVALTSTLYFKNFIMLIIILNAISLAVETTMSHEDRAVSYTFDILDNFFLSVYLVEFILKVYAHPYRYWTFGFNVFDFFILVISLIKAAFDWTTIGNGDYPILKLLVITRALRILRGISMSIQIQVLITALMVTLKTHVFSVLILLFLLIYIASIIAYFFFGKQPGLEDTWGNIFTGMLRLFSFVTMDGWTDTSEEFDKAGLTHTGRIWCLSCIVFGNFFISNIFIAIIIMQISEATESFRARERDEREEVISVKKEIVFRRQKLDMRQLLAKQSVSSSAHADFYYMGSQFLRLLRHDDLVDMNSVHFSPLWMDAFYNTIQRCHHTANVVMNLHRQMADNLLEVHRKNSNARYTVTPIRRSRYNRYMKLKSKLAILRQEFFRDNPSMVTVRSPMLKVKLEKVSDEKPVKDATPSAQ